jgi:hypothetical protein
MQFKERTVNNANAIRIPEAIPCPEATDLDPDYHPCSAAKYLEEMKGQYIWSVRQSGFIETV